MNARNHLFAVLKSLMNVTLKPGNIIPSKVTPCAFLTLLFAITLLLWGLFYSPATAVNPESIADEETAPDTVEDAETPMSEGFKEKEEASARLPEWREKMKTLTPFLRDTRLNIHIRSFYFDRQRKEGKESEAWALGGSIDYASGRWKDIFQIGAVVYTSQKLYGPKEKSGAMLLKPVQEGFTTLGQAYLDAKIMEGLHFRGYRQTFNLPYVNKRDSRMVPNTFEALSVIGRDIHQIDFIVSHITKMKSRDATNFRWLSEIAGVQGEKKGMTMAGARYAFTKDLNAGIISQYGWDLWNTLYAEANYSMELTEDIAVALSAQYTDQRSVGDQLAGDFDTDVFSTQTGISCLGNIFTFAFSTTDKSHGIRNPLRQLSRLSEPHCGRF